MQRTETTLLAGRQAVVRQAVSSDFAGIHALLTECGLPCAGVQASSGQYWVAAQAGQLVGVIGAEYYDAAALLRSFAVTPAWRRSGIAAALLEQVWQAVQEQGSTVAYLLTNTAATYFACRGFTVVERTVLPPRLLAESALGSACAASSICMARPVQQGEGFKR